MLLALSVHPSFEGRIIGEDRVRSSGSNAIIEYIDGFGNRISRTVAPRGTTMFWSDCVVEVDGIPDQPAFNAKQHPVQDLPSETLNFLTASRYCDFDKMVAFAWNRFGQHPEGWLRVQAISDFVHHHVQFGYQFGRPDKTAADVFGDQTGVCRDFAHLGVSLCRAMNIPARYVSGYLGDIGVPDAGFDDFCAWFEVYLGDGWHTVDARYNTPRIGRVLMVKGTDASDVAMITSFGAYQLSRFNVWTTEMPRGMDDAALIDAMRERPALRQAPALMPA